MNWDNLKNFECPYCGWTLLDTIPDIKCSHCSFIISRDRVKDILRNRRGDPQRSSPMKWQNLHLGRCPVCGDFLKRSTDGKFDFQKCIRDDCPFKMREESLTRILDSPEHPANKFYEAENKQ